MVYFVGIMYSLASLKEQFKQLSSGRKALVIAFFVFVSLAFVLPGESSSESTSTNKNPVEIATSETSLNNIESPNENKVENLSEESKEENSETTYEVISITDGDTLRIMYEGKSTPLRLIGVDTPEINAADEPVQCYGNEAKEYLDSIVSGKKVYIEQDVSDKDKYDRLLRYVYVDGEMVNELLVKNGYAFASSYPPDTKYQQKMESAEIYAKGAKKGFWASDTCDGNIYTGTYLDPKLSTQTLPEVQSEKSYIAPTPQEVTDEPATKVTSSTNKTSPQTTTPTYVPVVPSSNTSTYTCNCKKTCPQMSSCAEAQFQLNSCGCSARDGDKDGIACDADCQ